MQLPRRRLGRENSLAGQVVAANVVLVTLTLFGASLAAGLDITIQEQRWQFLVLALAVVLTLCVNLWMLKRRFGPLDQLIASVERVDPSQPSSFAPAATGWRRPTAWRAPSSGCSSGSRPSARAPAGWCSGPRRRSAGGFARDLHDEVNQALTAILLRLEALAQEEPARAGEVGELKRLVNQAMDELTGLARHLRPSALDDHGLVPAVRAQLKLFSASTGIETGISTRGDASKLGDDEEIAVYRVAQEALTNAARHASAGRVDVELFIGPGGTELRVRDDGQGFDIGARHGDGLGLDGMAERARLLGGELDVRSAPGVGTTVELTLP